LGAMHIPRIGEEVLVTFIGGDPDLPICTGKVYNQGNLPPWALPDQAALSGFRSRELTKEGGNSAAGRSNHLILDDTDQKIQVQLKSDHQSSSLSLGHITRIDGHAGRQDARGEGIELRTDGHAVVRAQQGLLLTTEARPNAAGHVKDLGETVARLNAARNQHEGQSEAAHVAQAQEQGDQDEVVAALKRQNDAIQGTGQAGSGHFPELSEPHLVLASPAGIQTTTAKSTHLASDEHTALTSGGHTSVSAGKSFLVSVKKAIKFFAFKDGIKLVAAKESIDFVALKKTINLLAKLDITHTANRITLTAKQEIQINGAGSYTRWSAQGIEHGTLGKWVEHAGGHSMTGPASRAVAVPSLGSPVYAASKEQSLSFEYHDDTPVQGAKFKIEYAAGQVHEGVFDAQGKADMRHAPTGSGRVRLGEDARSFVATALENNPAHRQAWSDADMLASLDQLRGRSA
ncbi:type VI secretion system Vgr family protein, partial [Aquabacterium sp.]|uniref:DUF2345 domain-containing protein n=1 Tax=Aquabacterium sp. TaxID=1872578 RepID=UPI001996636C